MNYDRNDITPSSLPVPSPQVEQPQQIAYVAATSPGRRGKIASFFSGMGKSKIAGVVVIVAILAGLPLTILTLGKQQNLRQKAATNIEFGANTHLSVNYRAQYPAYTNQDPAAFQQTVDELVAKNQRWIRVNINADEVAPNGTIRHWDQPPLSGYEISFNWNDQFLGMYSSLFDIAIQKGLKIMLVVNTPSFAKDFSDAEYEAIARSYFNNIVMKYGSKTAIWQFYNEPNIHSYRNYQPITPDATYISKLNAILQGTRISVRNVNPSALMTVNVGGTLNDGTFAAWETFYDAVSPNIDVMALDLYPDNNGIEIAKLPNRVNDMKTKYGKNVIVSELGICTGDGRFTEDDQKNYLINYLQMLKASDPMAILLYEMQDESGTNGCEGSFGLKRTDGTKKAGFDAIFAEMQNTIAPTAAPTQVPTPTLTPVAVQPTPTLEPIPTLVPTLVAIVPTAEPTIVPSPSPTLAPGEPSPTPAPTTEPTASAPLGASATPAPTAIITQSTQPTATAAPTSAQAKTADLNHDGAIDTQDYNIFIGCFGDKQNTSSCGTNKTAADMDSDGDVGLSDYKLFILGFTNH